jgi:DNA-directed RNA polymerase subunit RPC12/RpoP
MLTFPCSACGRQFSVADDFAGQQVQCPACQQIVVVAAAPITISSRPGGDVALAHPVPTSLDTFSEAKPQTVSPVPENADDDLAFLAPA